jgi:hypothetical protein
VITVQHPINDGTPHITFQHPQVNVNFVWDGEPTHPILVCPGGYAEEPDDLIEANTYWFGEKPQDVLATFKDICTKYLQSHGLI